MIDSVSPDFSYQYEVICDRLAKSTYRFRLRSAGTTAASPLVTWQETIALWQQSANFRSALTTASPLVTWQETIALWQQSANFRSALTTALAEVPFAAFFWETPPITATRLTQPWECVAVDAPALAAVAPNPEPFSRYLSHARQQAIATFPNLGGDALLVVPCEQGDISTYTHLANFVRQAPTAQVHRLWQVLGQTLQQHWMHRGDRPLWVSTSGLGVYWLHIRLDDMPKYYTHAAYRAMG